MYVEKIHQFLSSMKKTHRKENTEKKTPFFLPHGVYLKKCVAKHSSKHFLQCFDTVGWAAGRASGL